MRTLLVSTCPTTFMAKSICIIGGGSSGWMTAAAFAVRFPDWDITLVESEWSKPIGVGESTLGHFNRYLDCLGIEDKDWMPACSATYKLSIQFTNWKNEGDVFQYPFGDFDFSHGGFLDWYHIHNRYPEEFPDTTFAEFYNPVSHLAAANKMVDKTEYMPRYSRRWDAAYHFDADKFGQWLRENLCQKVTHVYGDITGASHKHTGDIAYLLDDKGHQYHADYFIDCTGFKSAILEGMMGVPFLSFEDDLPNDSAVAARVPYTDRKNQMKNTTDGYALDNGWVWTIPLWDRIGTGYVYSSKFCSEEQAEKEFREHIGWDGDVKHIKFRHGKHKHGWFKNVIGIGLSYGFLEPLESTGLFTTHENILRLVDTFERRKGKVTQIDIDGYNHAVSYELEAMKEFVYMHYYLSPRDDTPYWRYYTERSPLTYEEMFDKVVRSPRMYQEFLHCFNIANAPKDLGGLVYIAAGLGYHPLSPTDTEYNFHKGEISQAEVDHILFMYRKYKASVLKFVDSLPTHYEFLLKNIYGTDETEKTAC